MAASASAGRGKGFVDFEDLLPVIAKKLGGEGLMRELQKGFEVLMDKEKRVITLESLRRNSALLGLHDLKEDEIVSMLKEGDIDGDGVLNMMDFCVLMFRLSPQLMEDSYFCLQHALQHDELLHSSTLFHY
ncbi:poly(A)-binding protein binding protein [Stylosanthes scabra]|uniref:Poly(A)-binding protein binding protein n=1 Tax=Stylosanthes scabra TaxID=79078 RepID=A0ABU6WCK1_9FABA|nr:poly(A)-binding protein binding protein [Stylosanthes scabra]